VSDLDQAEERHAVAPADKRRLLVERLTTTALDILKSRLFNRLHGSNTKSNVEQARPPPREHGQEAQAFESKSSTPSYDALFAAAANRGSRARPTSKKA